MAVVEIVAVSHTEDGKEQQVACGWGILPIFKSEDDMPDVSSAKPPQPQR